MLRHGSSPNHHTRATAPVTWVRGVHLEGMNASTISKHRRVLIAAIAGALAVLVLAGIGIYGLIRGPHTNSPDPDTTGQAHTVAPSPRPPATQTGPLPIRDTTRAGLFARDVAAALFTWDTASGYQSSEYAQVIVNVGDPSGVETAGLAADVRAYLPTPQQWAQLRTHQTSQWLTIDSLSAPESWAEAEAQAAPGQLLPGTTAYTVTGTRHREGIWGTEPVESTRPVAFTMFITCEPTFDHCRLLRLSRVDEPLT